MYMFFVGIMLIQTGKVAVIDQKQDGGIKQSKTFN